MAVYTYGYSTSISLNNVNSNTHIVTGAVEPLAVQVSFQSSYLSLEFGVGLPRRVTVFLTNTSPEAFRVQIRRVWVFL